MAWRVQDRPHLLVVLDALIGLATLLANQNDVERAVEVLALVCGAASIDRHTQATAERSLAELEARLPAARFAAAQARGHKLALNTTVAAMLAEGAAYTSAVTYTTRIARSGCRRGPRARSVYRQRR